MPLSREDFYRKYAFSLDYTLSLYGPCTGVKKEIFKEINQFFTFYSNITFPGGGGRGHKIYIFLSLYPTDATYQIWFKIGPVVIEEKMVTVDGLQPIAIGHLSDSDDLNKKTFTVRKKFKFIFE